MLRSNEDDTGFLERARQKLYARTVSIPEEHADLSPAGRRALPHAWQDEPLPVVHHRGRRKVRLAVAFLIVSIVFFLVAAGIAGYFFYFGGDTVSISRIDLAMQGPTTIAGGDTLPLSLTITNRNPAELQNATLEIDFPPGTRSATDVTQPYTHDVLQLGTLASGGSLDESVRAVLFGSVGQNLSIPVILTYGIPGSNATFVKKTSYTVSISSTPLSVSVDTLSETTAGAPLTLTLTVRSNTNVPLNNVVLNAALPFGFSVASSSLPMSGSSFLLGTFQPGASKTITLAGTLMGQDQTQSTFHFTVGTSNTPGDATMAVSYMTQDATVTIAAPFINTSIAVNGDSSGTETLSPNAAQSVSVSYTNTLSTTVTNPVISVALSGSAIDYNSVQTSNGFYDSTTHTITFSNTTDPSLSSLAPAASGQGSFTFNTLPASSYGASPSVTFTTSVSGTRVGQSNVPEQVTANQTQTLKVATAVMLSQDTLYASGPVANTGPVVPSAGQQTTYTIRLSAQDSGAPIAGGTATLTLPVYVSFTGKTSGSGSITYNSASRTVTWDAGDIPQGTTAQAYFQVAITPSTSQKGSAPALTSSGSFSAYDRFAGVQVSASANPATTAEVDYAPANQGGEVQ